MNDYEGIGGHGSLRCDLGCLYLLTLDAAGVLQRLELQPFRLRRFRLEPADGAAREWLGSVFDGNPFGTRVEPTAEGGWLLRFQVPRQDPGR